MNSTPLSSLPAASKSTTNSPGTSVAIGAAKIWLRTNGDMLTGIGAVEVGGAQLRNPAIRWLPWFDTNDGHIFRSFRFVGVEHKGTQVHIVTRAISDPDYPFQERRDCSGDVCLRSQVWDAEPIESDLRIVFEPVTTTVDGRSFHGFRYWYEYSNANAPIHRILDRQTWELGGDLTDVNVVCRNLFDVPRKRVTVDGTYSTVGLNHPWNALPGNLWARWSLLPAFDMQYGSAGVMLAWFDRVSLIRTAIESTPGENWLRYIDVHYFTQSGTVANNPKTVLFCPDVIDDVEALNLWTRVHDLETRKALDQFGVKEEQPPLVQLALNIWQGIKFDTAYEEVVERASNFGADIVFIDAIWQNGETLRQTLETIAPSKERDKNGVLAKLDTANMCCSFDFIVSETAGGEDGLRRLCERAAAKGVKIMSWMSAHYWEVSKIRENKELGHGASGIFAAKESGRHPDTGYATHCWTINLNAPIFEHVRKQILDTCKRTGLAGFLWDSFSNLGWWQIDFSKGDMRPQFDRMAQLWADLTNAGLYIQPEAVVSFTSHSGCGLFAGDVYAGDLLGYSYNTVIGLHYQAPGDTKVLEQSDEIIAGRKPFGLLFQVVAHKRIPPFNYGRGDKKEWVPERFEQIKELIRVYKQVRGKMVKRTVLHGNAGVVWEDGSETAIFFAFGATRVGVPIVDVATGKTISDGTAVADRVYQMPTADLAKLKQQSKAK